MLKDSLTIVHRVILLDILGRPVFLERGVLRDQVEPANQGLVVSVLLIMTDKQSHQRNDNSCQTTQVGDDHEEGLQRVLFGDQLHILCQHNVVVPPGYHTVGRCELRLEDRDVGVAQSLLFIDSKVFGIENLV